MTTNQWNSIRDIFTVSLVLSINICRALLNRQKNLCPDQLEAGKVLKWYIFPINSTPCWSFDQCEILIINTEPLTFALPTARTSNLFTPWNHQSRGTNASFKKLDRKRFSYTLAEASLDKIITRLTEEDTSSIIHECPQLAFSIQLERERERKKKEGERERKRKREIERSQVNPHRYLRFQGLDG